MKTFLFEIAEKLVKSKALANDLTLVFPNRRAILYFRKHLGTLLDRPVFSPSMLSMEDFVGQRSSYRKPDKMELLHGLYRTYAQVLTERTGREYQETFDQFYFWGDMLLRDFDELDRYAIPVDKLFTDIRHFKELDGSFDFLTPEQKEYLILFWKGFEENLSGNREKFIQLWELLHPLYVTFRAHLHERGLAYEGMLYREVAESLEKQTGFSKNIDTGHAMFIGFNALTHTEARIMAYFVQNQNSEIVWDLDAYYVNNTVQEAGQFFREYQQHPVLGKTFPPDIPSHLVGLSVAQSPIQVYESPQVVAQAKGLAQVLEEGIRQGMNIEETLIVLPDEKLLFPVLHSVSGLAERLNVTMGFPLASTPMYDLIERLLALQITYRDGMFHYREVLALLEHPYMVGGHEAVVRDMKSKLISNNWAQVPSDFLRQGSGLFKLAFCPLQENGLLPLTPLSLIGYVKQIAETLGQSEAFGELDREYAFQFIKLFNRLADTVYSGMPESQGGDIRETVQSFLRLFRQLARSEKMPFSGEPLEGLQLMGVLETRNLDFKNVFILSLNEGAFPKASDKGSYIPYNIRKAYSLPVGDHQDAMYAYLFYRMVQRAENVFLFYTAETEARGQGEMSRFLRQFMYESGRTFVHQTLDQPIQPLPIKPIVIEKDGDVWDRLSRFCVDGKGKRVLSPSALGDYLECRLKFYFRKVAGLAEPQEVEGDLDARVLGNLLHKAMEKFYLQMANDQLPVSIGLNDIESHEKHIDSLIDQVFVAHYGLDKGRKVVYEGQRYVVREILVKFLLRIFAMDKQYAPFTMEALEWKDLQHGISLDVQGNPEVVLGGIIDRVDRKGDTVRIVDYKTGKDKVEVSGDIPDLFLRDGKNNKAAFQTMFYAMLYVKNNPVQGLRVLPGLINRGNLFDDQFMFGLRQDGEIIADVVPLLPEFEVHLKKTLEEIYDPAQPFDQTQEPEVCGKCPFTTICSR